MFYSRILKVPKSFLTQKSKFCTNRGKDDSSNLMQWAKENGFNFPKISLETIMVNGKSAGRGLTIHSTNFNVKDSLQPKMSKWEIPYSNFLNLLNYPDSHSLNSRVITYLEIPTNPQLFLLIYNNSSNHLPPTLFSTLKNKTSVFSLFTFSTKK